MIKNKEVWMQNMDHFWDACYAAGITKSPSLASIPCLPNSCQRDLRRYYDTDDVIIGSGSFGSIRRVRLLSPVSTGIDDNKGNDTTTINHHPHQQQHQYYACKTITKINPYDRDLLQREVFNLNRCQMTMQSNSNNNNVIRLLDVIEDRFSIHIITEFCSGGELYDFIVQQHNQHNGGRGLRGRTVGNNKDDDDDDEELRCATIIYQILTALRFLHDDVGICHRDMKASNFVFVKHPLLSLELRIIDFGLSKYIGTAPTSTYNNGDDNPDEKEKKQDTSYGIHEDTAFRKSKSYAFEKNDTIYDVKKNSDNSDDNSNDSNDINTDDDEKLYPERFGYMTSEVGAAYYVAPEVLTQHSLDSPGSACGYTTKCDIWSIGVLTFLTLTGTLPVMGKNEQETVQKLRNPMFEVDFSDETLWYQENVDDASSNGNNNHTREDRDNNLNGDTHGSTDNNKKRISRLARDFCKSLLERDPNKRPTAEVALGHCWLKQHFKRMETQIMINSTNKTDKERLLLLLSNNDCCYLPSLSLQMN